MIDKYTCDLTNPTDVRAVFEKYGKGGFWGVVHVAVRFSRCPLVERDRRAMLTFLRFLVRRQLFRLTRQWASRLKFRSHTTTTMSPLRYISFKSCPISTVPALSTRPQQPYTATPRKCQFRKRLDLRRTAHTAGAR